MAALLRHGRAARRLGASIVQRAHVAVVEERRRLVHTDESARAQVILEIQQKKEALYDAISRAEKQFFICTWWNRMLAHDLSVQVTPRPFDSNWRRLQLANRVNGVLHTAGHVSLSGILAITIFLGGFGSPLEEEENAAQPPLTSKGSGDNI